MAASAGPKKVFEAFVTRVPWTLASKEIKEYFSQFGVVKKCLVPFDKETGFHRGFGWVRFASEEGLQNALLKESHIIEGSKLQVQQNRRQTGMYTNRGTGEPGMYTNNGGTGEPEMYTNNRSASESRMYTNRGTGEPGMYTNNRGTSEPRMYTNRGTGEPGMYTNNRGTSDLG
ncbi:SRA stem-loop-interacting RNA-binding protein, mitochondrial [Ambystoma mexicanum]|uniref:SRA stem-loop-interacting RNA-binding protein, mitochondrial n=1 Tax=Ambystoma mexicanum TaxID=8296 RepID=UPI0037E7006C